MFSSVVVQPAVCYCCFCFLTEASLISLFSFLERELRQWVPLCVPLQHELSGLLLSRRKEWQAPEQQVFIDVHSCSGSQLSALRGQCSPGTVPSSFFFLNVKRRGRENQVGSDCAASQTFLVFVQK